MDQQLVADPFRAEDEAGFAIRPESRNCADDAIRRDEDAGELTARPGGRHNVRPDPARRGVHRGPARKLQKGSTRDR
jgi:hypothetical protein